MKKVALRAEEIRWLAKDMLKLAQEQKSNALETWAAAKWLQVGLENAVPTINQVKPKIEQLIEKMKQTTETNQEEKQNAEKNETKGVS